jgi:hypothetical protein
VKCIFFVRMCKSGAVFWIIINNNQLQIFSGRRLQKNAHKW